MAQYEVHIPRLCESGENFKMLAVGLDSISRRMENVITALQKESLLKVKKQLITEKDSILKTAAHANTMGRMLLEISDIYALAEKTAFSDAVPVQVQQRQEFPVVTPNIIKPVGLLLFGELLLPDWIQMAIIKYEQSQT